MEAGRAEMSPVCSKPDGAAVNTPADKDKTAACSASSCRQRGSDNCGRISDVTTGRTASVGLE